MDLLKFIALAGVVGYVNLFKACTAPFVIGFLIYFTGIVFQSKPAGKFWSIWRHAVWLSVGFAATFVFKAMTLSKLAVIIVSEVSWITRIGGLILLLVAAATLGAKFLKKLNSQWVWNLVSLFMGGVFALTWQPCSKIAIPLVQAFMTKPESLFFGTLMLSFVAVGIILPLLILTIPFTFLYRWLLTKPSVANGMRVTFAIIFIIMGFLFITGQIAVFYGLAGQIVAPLIIK